RMPGSPAQYSMVNAISGGTSTYWPMRPRLVVPPEPRSALHVAVSVHPRRAVAAAKPFLQVARNWAPIIGVGPIARLLPRRRYSTTEMGTERAIRTAE